MRTVTTSDGTTIAYEQAGAGQPIIFVGGAFNDHTIFAPLAGALEPDHTVITYDRRARGESGDTRPYAIERETEDLTALIDQAGASAAVFGYSSGAVLALKAAADGAKITQLMMYEAPFAFDASHAGPKDLPTRLQAMIDEGLPGEAVATFQLEGIGLPAEMVAQIRQSPQWPALEAIAQSLVYDATITTTLPVPTAEMTAVGVPVLVLNGAATWPAVRQMSQTLAGLLPTAEHRELPGGQDHGIPTAETAEAVRQFLAR